MYNHPVVSEAPSEVAEFCSCVKGTRLHIPNLPKGNAEDFIPNTTPKAGVAILFTYSDGTHHIAYVESLNEEGMHVIHYNKEKCQRTEEVVSWENPYITGFFEPVENDIYK